MTKSSSIKILAGLASVVAVAGLSLVSVKAADTTVTSLTVGAGALTMYAGDATDNNDLCETGNVSTGNLFMQDGGTLSSAITCAPAEQTVTLTGVNVRSSRQSTTPAVVNDILCEDLTGSEDNTYSVTATIGDLDNRDPGNPANPGPGADIVLGSNPDTALQASEETAEPDIATITSGGNLFAIWNPADAEVANIAPETARLANVAGESPSFTSGALTVVDSAIDPVGVYSTAADTIARRFDQDLSTLKYRIPAFVDAGLYRGSIVFTCAAT